MLGKWYQLYVKAPEGNGYTTPEAIKRVDDQLVQIFGAMATFTIRNGLPVQENDGTWEVRVQAESILSIVKRILTDQYGLEILQELERD